MKSLLLAVIACAMLCSSCSDKLSRSKAEDLIKKKTTFPYSTWAEIPKDFIIPLYRDYNWDNSGCISDEWIHNLKELKDQDLIVGTNENKTIPEGTIGAGYVQWLSCHIALTDKGKPYSAGEGRREFKFYGGSITTTKVNLYENEFDAITGIVEQEQPVHGATVTYTVKRTRPTPFNDILKEDLTKKETYTAYFTKYDDGWRVERVERTE